MARRAVARGATAEPSRCAAPRARRTLGRRARCSALLAGRHRRAASRSRSANRRRPGTARGCSRLRPGRRFARTARARLRDGRSERSASDRRVCHERLAERLEPMSFGADCRREVDSVANKGKSQDAFSFLPPLAGAASGSTASLRKMNSRRQFLITAPFGLLGAVTACRNAPESQQQGTPPAGAPPTFGTAPAVGPEVSPATFAEAEKLAQVEMTHAQRTMAARSWRTTMAAMLERRTGPRKIALEPTLAPATRWNPVISDQSTGPAAD